MQAIAIRDNQDIMQAINTDLLDRFISFIDAKPATIATYSRNLRQFFTWLAANGISSPTRADVITYRRHLEASGHKPATITGYIVAVRQFFKWTESEGIYSNVGVNVKGAKIDNTFKKDPLTSRQAKEVLARIDTDTLTGKRDHAIMVLMMTCGLRTIEVIRANVEDMRTLGNETVLYIQGKGRDEKADCVKLAPETEAAIRAYLSIRGKTSSDAPLFASESHRNAGERMTTRSISRIVKDGLRAAGLDSERLTAHSLRHTAGTLNLLNGGTLDETQQLLRHAKIDTTMRYLHHMDRVKNDSEYRIAAAIFGSDPVKRNRRPKP